MISRQEAFPATVKALKAESSRWWRADWDVIFDAVLFYEAMIQGAVSMVIIRLFDSSLAGGTNMQ